MVHSDDVDAESTVLKGAAAGARPEVARRTISLDPASRMTPADLRASAGRGETLLAAARLRQVSGASRRLVAVISLDARDGASALTARIGLALAELDKDNILVLDANASSSETSRLFGVSNQPGLQDVLEERTPLASALHCIDSSNLWILPLGESNVSMVSLLGSPCWAAALKELRERFRYILIDAGTIGSAECMLIASACDGVLLALAAGRTKDEAGRFQEELKRLQIPLLGAMLTTKRSGRN